MRWPLRYQIFFPFAGVMLAAVLVVSLLDAALSARRSQAQIERQLQDVATTLQDASFPLTAAVLRQTRGLSGAELVVADARGRTLAASLPKVPEVLLAEREARANVRLEAPLRVAERDYLHAAVELSPRDPLTSPRVLHILYPQDDLRLARWEAAYPSLVVGSLMLLLVAVLAYVIARRMSFPILELRRQLAQLVQGDFQPLPSPPRNDELGDLVRSVNSLGDQLHELKRVIKRSERLSLLGQLSGGLAHQLRNSVTGARIAVQLHGRHCRGVDDDSLEVALRQLSITESHLQQFLTLGRPARPQRQRCDLVELVGEVTALVAPACKHQRVALEVRASETAEISADAEQLRQMLMNLVLNAIEAAGAGGWVRIEISRDTHRATLRVLDSGPGPDKQLAERLFEPFVTGKPEGIGLGLSVVRQIVLAHGGTIRLMAGPPTQFEVLLPDGPPVAGPAAIPAETLAQTSAI